MLVKWNVLNKSLSWFIVTQVRLVTEKMDWNARCVPHGLGHKIEFTVHQALTMQLIYNIVLLLKFMLGPGLNVSCQKISFIPWLGSGERHTIRSWDISFAALLAG